MSEEINIMPPKKTINVTAKYTVGGRVKPITGDESDEISRVEVIEIIERLKDETKYGLDENYTELEKRFWFERIEILNEVKREIENL